MRFLNKYIKKYWKLFCLAVLCLTAEATCDLMQPTIMSKIIDKGVAAKEMNYVLHMGGIMLLVTFWGAIAATSRNIIASMVSQKFGTELRLDLFKKIQTLSFDEMDKFEGASLVTRLTNDVTQLQNFVNGLMRIFVKAPILCIGSLIMATRLNAKMALVFVVVIPVVTVIIAINMKVGYPLFVKIQNSIDKVNGVMREYLAGVRVVKAFNRFNYEKQRFEKCNEDLTTISVKSMRTLAIFSPSITLVVNLAIVVIIWIGGIRVNNGSMKVGQIIAFTNYMTQILFSLMIISNVFTMFIRAKASANRINEVFLKNGDMKNLMYYDEASSDIDDSSERYKFPEQNHNNLIKSYHNASNIKGKIDFENVSFSYSNSSGEPILKNISFSCNTGETIGIIGSTGCGKSTIVSLTLGFYNASSGSVKVNDINIRNMNTTELREKIAVVSQKIVLFSGTIIENIKWGKNNATIEEIHKASKVAQAHEFISSFSEGYETVLGQGGVNLSGGQKQRISIARALVKQPEILILDDCTSAVDVKTEGKIREVLREYSKSLTCIIIAQRISSVINADKIIVLDDGEVVSIGTHDELIKNCDVYMDIYRSQFGKIVS